MDNINGMATGFLIAESRKHAVNTSREEAGFLPTQLL